jgi:Arc/MetJ-type ribon-helix-helix transcriptional regulator
VALRYQIGMHSGILNGMSPQIALRLDADQLAAIDSAVSSGRFPSRAAAIRAGIERVLREEREREIVEAYRRGYGERPQEGWVGDAGLALGAELVKAERRAGSRRGRRRH